MAPTPTTTAASRPALAVGLLRLLRPRQWSKNVLVFAAPGAAGVLTEADSLGATLVALLAFCLAASGTYCLNDASDVEADRLHSTKRNRPVASGIVPVRLAQLLGVVLVASGVLVGFATGSWKLPALTAGYVVLTTSYTLVLKRIAVLDIATVAAGFVVRALAGAVATEVPISDWFLVVASFGSLFMVAGKRSAELDHGGDVAGQRAVLSQYSTQFLVYVRAVSSGVVLLAYTLFALEKADVGGGFVWFELSIVPFTLAILRYALRLDQGGGGAPEDIVLGDRVLQALGLVWSVVFALGVYRS
ncbi:MAG: decaprenyl-phosphate phosphoribosyltransferase [Actinobacteria bacterium]|nr:decaprenyl-phosphate phosphoribosyltransferase [Actinomycetota bacterium]MDP8954703.1 decaprenyl-phosphate phosphoribosyltransferase [Actinomycetota bacterium]